MTASRFLATAAARAAGCCLTLLLAACASSPPTGGNRAPVEERSTRSTPSRTAPKPAPPVVAPTPAASAADAPKVATGVENAGKPGYYTVRPGDTLIRIGLEQGQSWRDLQRWNTIDNADRIEVGQVLRVVPPGQDPGAAAPRPVTTARVESRPLDGRPVTPAAPSAPISPTTSTAATNPTPAPAANGSTTATPPSSAGGSTPSATPASGTSGSPAASAPAPAAATDDEPQWLWPATGTVVSGFDETRNKGVAIGGKAGDPVLATADGRVVYAGSGLRGYGNLIILKHNETYLSAYAHNQQLLVKEDQAVKRGQKIAEMGSSEAPRVQLHFEIRRKGRPLDPTKVLPAR